MPAAQGWKVGRGAGAVGRAQELGVPRGAAGVPQSKRGLRSHSDVAISGTGVTCSMALSLDEGAGGHLGEADMFSPRTCGAYTPSRSLLGGKQPLWKPETPFVRPTDSRTAVSARSGLAPARGCTPPRLTPGWSSSRTPAVGQPAGPRRSRQPPNHLLPAGGGAWPRAQPASQGGKRMPFAAQPWKGLREGSCR